MRDHFVAFMVQIIILLYWTWAMVREIRDYYRTKLRAKDDLHEIDEELEELNSMPQEEVEKDPALKHRHLVCNGHLKASAIMIKDNLRFARLHMIISITFALMLYTCALAMLTGYFIEAIHDRCPFGNSVSVKDVQVEVHNCTNTVDGVLGPQWTVEVK